MTVTITELHTTGVGVAQNTEYGRIYVPFAFPSETVAIELGAAVRTGQWNARRIDHSTSFCTVAGRCGGCLWPGAPYAEQLVWKERLVRRVLAPLLAFARLAMEIHSCKTTSEFRSRLHLHANIYQNRFTCGLYERGERTLVPLADCPVAAAPLRRIVAELATLSETTWPYENFGFGVELSFLPEENAVLLVLYASAKRRHTLEAMLSRFAALPSHPLAHIAYAEDNPTYVWQRLPHATMYTRPGCFQQGNTAQSDTIRSLIAAAIRESQPKIFFDLYCGSGNYSLPLAHSVDAVYGVDDSTMGIQVGLENLRRNAIGNAHFVQADVQRVLENPMHYDFPPRADIVVLDPARFGIGRAVPTLLNNFQPQRVVLISNNLTALYTDCRALLAAGFEPLYIHLVDFFPHTPHMNLITIWHSAAPAVYASIKRF
ncbi:MAG: class I SAM-dependent RNA methyltransferase [Spirochaetes bacterium]|nr:class I SAM-dependent RNA methyltransferase [Spirochaetota bacterium]